ncbi:MAG TPA: hypothetical protein VKV17_18620 [Bryobacteraceae bacterium]|nr:hypothetical protein [Bryobacteraceae bacterium]
MKKTLLALGLAAAMMPFAFAQAPANGSNTSQSTTKKAKKSKKAKKGTETKANASK